MESIDLLKGLIEEERLKLPDQDVSRVCIGGFSQGCIVALGTLLTW